MDAISAMVGLFLNLSVACNALPAMVTRLQGEDFQVLQFECGAKSFRVWSRRCVEGGYWTRPFLLEETTSGQGFYFDRFAEVHSGWHVRLEDTYVPRCGT